MIIFIEAAKTQALLNELKFKTEPIWFLKKKLNEAKDAKVTLYIAMALVHSGADHLCAPK
jgi:hypothetical protein